MRIAAKAPQARSAGQSGPSKATAVRPGFRWCGRSGRTPIAAPRCDTLPAPPIRTCYDPTWRSPVTMENPERLLTPGEVALMFRVDPKTVTRWASAGRIGSIRTPGGHRRFRESEVSALLADLTVDASRSTA